MATDRSGADQAFVDFYKASFPKVYRAVLLMARDRTLAEESSNQAFEKAYARWGRLRKEQWVEGWVMTSAMNLCRRQLSRLKQHRERSQISGADAASSLTSDLSVAEERVDLLRAMASLTPRQLMATTLFYLGDLPLPAVADQMGISEGTVKALLNQSRKVLRAALEVRNVG
jgi:RNA polymerase sigma-70 factor, ECF subfamily